jgi:hypothetical protein
VLLIVLSPVISSTNLRYPNHHLINNVQINTPKASTWKPQLVPSCIIKSGTKKIFAVEMRTPTYDNVWERQFRISSLPTEIMSRVRCQDWSSDQDKYGGRGPNPPTPNCVVDEKYYVGSKRTMLAATLGLRDFNFFFHANFLILGLGGGNQPMQFRSLFPLATVSAVEIDKEDLELAQKCFGLTKDKKIHIYIDEASSFISSSAANSKHTTFQTYDIIINDIATNIVSLNSGISGAGNTHDSFHSIDFFSNVVKLLNHPNGLFLMNQRLNKVDPTKVGTKNDSNADVLNEIELTMKQGGFQSVKSLVNVKVQRAIIIGSVNNDETFSNLQDLLIQNCEKLNLTIENGEYWRNVDILTEELNHYV